DGVCTVTSRAGGDVIFASTINGTQAFADTLFVNSSGLTAFDAAVGVSVGLRLLETNPPGTIRTAPSANALAVIYGELHQPDPAPEAGVAELVRSVSSVWSPTVLPLDAAPPAQPTESSGSMNELLEEMVKEAQDPDPVASPRRRNLS
ncbi:MAG: hypothetical protein JNK53_08875, partial [Phycisphaerae bacterium]|nr:hypothetical protein [Phycisphaerae bacterium]